MDSDRLLSCFMIGAISLILYFFVREPRHDYYIELDRNQIYIIDKNQDTVHSEQVNWSNPSKFQKIFIQDNL